MKRKISLMCDVEADGVVAAPDAPSIYDIPKVLHREGLDAYVVRRLGLPFRDVDWTVWGDLLDRVHHPDETVTHRAGRQVRRPARRLPVGHRGAARGRVRPPRPGGDPLGALRRLPDPRGRGGRARRRRRRAACRAGSACAASRASSARCGTPAPAASRPSGCASACSAWSSRRPATLAGLEDANSTEFDERTPHPVISTMADQLDVVAGERDMGGTMRLGAYPAMLGAGHGGRGGLRRARGLRAAPAPLRGQQRLPGPARRGRAWSSAAPRRTARSSSSSSCRPTSTRSSSARRPTRS